MQIRQGGRGGGVWTMVDEHAVRSRWPSLRERWARPAADLPQTKQAGMLPNIDLVTCAQRSRPSTVDCHCLLRSALCCWQCSRGDAARLLAVSERVYFAPSWHPPTAQGEDRSVHCSPRERAANRAAPIALEGPWKLRNCRHPCAFETQRRARLPSSSTTCTWAAARGMGQARESTAIRPPPRCHQRHQRGTPFRAAHLATAQTPCCTAHACRMVLSSNGTSRPARQR